MLIFSADKWLVTPRIRQVLGILQDQVVQQLTGRLPQQRLDRKWDYTSAEAARAEAGFEPMETYIRQRQNTAA